MKRYAVHDGPGIRLTFFLKGCPLHCLWCHNPEGIPTSIETYTRIDRLGEREFPVQSKIGYEMDMGALCEEVEKERVFLEESGGGVTFSGGEPLLQGDFLLEALQVLRQKGVHTAVDTSGWGPEKQAATVAGAAGLILFDLKGLDDAKHINYTGVSGNPLRKNLDMMLATGTPVWIRIPIIPGINDSPAEISEMVAYLKERAKENIEKINLLPYHRTGSSKHRRFGIKPGMPEGKEPAPFALQLLKKQFETTGLPVKTGG